jgi:hypothetical protein
MHDENDCVLVLREHANALIRSGGYVIAEN